MAVLTPRPELVRQASPEEAASLDELFRRHSSFVARLAFRLLGRDDEVDDVVQDVFLAAHRGLRALENRDAARSWLATVAVRTARRKLRARRVKAWLSFDGGADYLDVADESATPDQRVLLATAYRVLDELPANLRIAWVLRHVEGESLERVAELCGCSLATAKRRIQAAQERIGEVMSDG